jgi:Putative transmembrane protein (Alph_Pro_TM)
MRKGGFCPRFSAVFIVLFILGSPVSGTAGTLTCQPPALERTLFSKRFHTITFTGPAPEGSQIILKIVSPDREFKLNKSGKGLGFVWLPVGHAQVTNIPGMYALLSSNKNSEIPSNEGTEAIGLTRNFKEIYQRAKVHHQENPKPDEGTELDQEYISGLIKILEGRQLYQQKEGAVEINGGQFKARLIHPADAPLGEYRIFCYALKDGQAQLLAEDRFIVKSTGLAEWLSHQARMNAAVYGILAALIAVGVGLFVGVIFKRGGGH